jgi:DNA-binding GntR family transcriptional regulator
MAMGLKRERPKLQTFTQQVVDQLREMILCGDLKEGEQLRQDMLATALQVSRIPVREALRQIEAEGLVTFYPHRGVIVSELSLDDIREVFDARALLECDMLGRAIPKLTTDDFDRADEVLATFDEAFAKDDVRVW